jgi:hypothetical protein
MTNYSLSNTGYGIGNMINSVYQKAAPIIKSAVKDTIKQTVGNIVNGSTDIISVNKPKLVYKKRATSGKKKIGSGSKSGKKKIGAVSKSSKKRKLKSPLSSGSKQKKAKKVNPVSRAKLPDIF